MNLNAALPWKISLFTDSNPCLETDIFPSHTKCVLAGYSDIDLLANGWVDNESTGPVQTLDFDDCVFTFDPYLGGTTITGYQVVADNGVLHVLLWAERLDTPYDVPSGGGSLTVTPHFVYRQCDE
jgi:hypothetical protein